MENTWQDFPFQQVTQLHSLLTITARLFAWSAGAMLLTTTLPAQFQTGQLFVAAATAGTTRVPEPWVAEYALIAPSLDTRPQLRAKGDARWESVADRFHDPLGSIAARFMLTRGFFAVVGPVFA
jgi:hypothetical protein